MTIKTKLQSKKGETLIEAIISILLLTIMLTTITAMIGISQRMTANAMIRARNTQDRVINQIILKSDDLFDPGARIVFSDDFFINKFINNTEGIIEHDLHIFNADNIDDDEVRNSIADIISFYPDD